MDKVRRMKQNEAEIIIDEHYSIGQTDKRLFGSFAEHLGRYIYGGIYDPESPAADADGFRTDVLDLVKELNVPLVRYPGGNYVSSFRWEDGIGPKEQRKRRLDLAWRAVEPNTFGLGEFMKWVRLAGAEPMMAINLGTRGIEQAADLVEYCNHPGGSYLSDMRRQNGDEKPYNIRTWCLGNEMDGPWQVGQKTPDEYGRIAYETAKALKLFDPALELVACGSSFPAMPTFPQWEETVLSYCYDKVDYISMHQYQNNNDDNLQSYLACSLGMDRFIDTVASVCDVVQAKKRSAKKMYISFDEWNIWFHTLASDRSVEPWTVGPALLEDVYTFEDALVLGCLINSLLRHADRVKIACLAQLVNVIAPIMTDGKHAWRQTIFWPFYYASNFGRGTVLDIRCICGRYSDSAYGDVPDVDAAAVKTDDGISVFAVNRSAECRHLSFAMSGCGPYCIERHVELAGCDMKAVNTSGRPDAVRPVEHEPEGYGTDTELKPHSWNFIALV